MPSAHARFMINSMEIAKILKGLALIFASFILSVQADDSIFFTVIHVKGRPYVARSKPSKLSESRKYLAVNDRIFPQDQIVTIENEAVGLKGQDGSDWVVTSNSVVEVSVIEGADRSLTLKKGKLLGDIPKKSLLPATAKPYRIFIRTKTATMGIRGTQIVAESFEEEKHSRFYVLDGAVDIAKDAMDFMTKNFVVAQAGQLVETAGEGVEFIFKNTKEGVTEVTDTIDSSIRGVSKALPFDVFGMMAKINETLPESLHLPFLVGEKENSKNQADRIYLSHFEFFSQGYFKKSELPLGRHSYGLGMSWNPSWHDADLNWEYRAHLGLPRLFYGEKHSLNEIEIKLSAARIFKKLYYVEVGPLIQFYDRETFGANSAMGLSVNAGIWFGDHKILRLFDRFFFGVNWLHSPFPNLEYRFGAAFRLM